LTRYRIKAGFGFRLRKGGTDVLTPNTPSCYDLHRKDSSKSGK
jgi:hypothetical protein